VQSSFLSLSHLQCLFTLEPEKLETLLETVKKSLDEVKASGRDNIDPTDRKKIQDDFELSDLQVASAVSWTPREYLRRRTSAEFISGKEAKAPEASGEDDSSAEVLASKKVEVLETLGVD